MNEKQEPERMELFRTHQYYILLNKNSTLWIDRTTGQLDAKPAWELANGQDIECLGVFYGLVGRVRYNKVDRFILIRDSVLVGTVPLGNEVYKIKSIVLLNPTTDHVDDLGLRICAKHNYEDFLSLSVTPEAPTTGNSAFARAWGNVKSATLNQLKPSNFQTNPQSKGPSLNYKENLNLSKNERRLEEEILRIFTDSDSFYYCPDNKGDITNAVPRQGGELDDRFFWNKHMLGDIIEIGTDLSKAWVNPIIQGYVEIAPIYKLDLSLILISRRSRFRAGTRYKRRGLNPDGHCANYVETEQIISFKSHAVSFLQVRGSVPLYWSQPGIKYRPAPILHRNFAENQTAFEKHFEEQLSLYSKVIVVNLVEQLGKESIMHNAYTQHVLSLNNEQLVYVSFDFHEYCRGMHFERVSLLVDKLKSDSIFRDMGYSWKDKQGLICEQNSVFRVNCIDCLDRTNVVQTALAKAVLIKQLKKLGIVSPEGDLPKDMNSKFQVMWANNGDIISKQYAGTAALKGDFTRTGDRKLSGLMKDGVTSANRYYLSRFKDNMRQTCLNIMCGETENADAAISDEDDEEDQENANDNSEEEEKTSLLHIKTLIEDCKRLMLTDAEHVINAWPLLIYEDQATGLSGEDFDRILILTKDLLKIAEYNVHLDSMALLVCVPLKMIQGIYLGTLHKSTTSTPVSNSNSAAAGVPHSKPKRLYMKLVLANQNGDRQDLVLTSSRVHYFNNQVSIVRSIDEKNEALRAVGESIQICMRLCDCQVEVQYGPIDLTKSRSQVVSNVMSYIKKHRKQSDGGVLLSQSIQMEIGKEADESYMPNIGIIRSNVSIEASDELDLNDILIDENLPTDDHSTSTDLSSKPNSSDSHHHTPPKTLENQLAETNNSIRSEEDNSFSESQKTSRSAGNSSSERATHGCDSKSADGTIDGESNSQDRIDNDVRLNENVEFNNNNTMADSKTDVGKEDGGQSALKGTGGKRSSLDDGTSNRTSNASTSNSHTSNTNTSNSNSQAHSSGIVSTAHPGGIMSSAPSSGNAPTTLSSGVGHTAHSSGVAPLSGSAHSSGNVPNSKSSVIVKLNSCDLQDSAAAFSGSDKKPHFTLDLIPAASEPDDGFYSGTAGSGFPNSMCSGQNRSNENLSTLRESPMESKLVKSSSEKDLLLTNTIKTSQSDNTSLRQNIRTAIVSPTNALSKFVTKGVANLNSLDPRRRLSMNTTPRVGSNLGSPGGVGGGQEAREKLEEKWRKHGCKSKLIAL